MLKKIIRLGIIADDLTGSNDTGVQFAKHGLATVVGLDAAGDECLFRAAEVVVVNTDSRWSRPSEAYDRVKAAAELLKAAGVQAVYKKVDSAIRGNIGAEVDAVMDAYNCRVAFVAPAYPANNRITVNGHQLLRNKPLSETEMAADLLSPVVESHVPTLLAEQSRRRIGHVELRTVSMGVSSLCAALECGVARGEEIIVIDAVSSEDLRNIAQAITALDCVSVAVGSAGLAAELPASLGLVRHRPKCVERNPRSGVVVVNGSISPVARDQVQHASESLNVSIVGIDVNSIVAAPGRHRKSIQEDVRRALAQLEDGRDIAICLLPGATAERVSESDQQPSIERTESSRKIVRHLGSVVAAILASHSPLGLILTGGDTALSVCTSMGASGIALNDEIVPGVPVGHLIGGLEPGLAIVTKAGSFGEVDTISRVVRYLRSTTTPSATACLGGRRIVARQ